MTLASPVERREFVRIETWTTAHIIATGADGPAALQGTAINISLGGCAIKVAGAAQLAPGQVLVVGLSIGGEVSHRLARVTSVASGSVHLGFTEKLAHLEPEVAARFRRALDAARLAHESPAL